MIKTDAVIVGAGPCGLFQVFELGLQGIRTHLVDSLATVGGQCAALYPDKPIYDIPAIRECNANELIDRLLDQIEPFDPVMHLDQQVTVVEKLSIDEFRVETSKGTKFETRSLIIAGGVGSFQPLVLRAQGVNDITPGYVHYQVTDSSLFKDKKVVVLGGGDSAFDWALNLVDSTASLTLVHRSERFRAMESSVQEMRKHVENGNMNFLVGNATQLNHSAGKLEQVQITQPDHSVVNIDIDHLLVFFGLSPKLGPIAEWGLALNKNQIETDTERFETNVPGIYAIGDISSYPGKRKLILSGFHEAALVSFAIKKRLNPEAKVHLQYTTTSPLMHERLGVQST